MHRHLAHFLTSRSTPFLFCFWPALGCVRNVAEWDLPLGDDAPNSNNNHNNTRGLDREFSMTQRPGCGRSDRFIPNIFERCSEFCPVRLLAIPALRRLPLRKLPATGRPTGVLYIRGWYVPIGALPGRSSTTTWRGLCVGTRRHVSRVCKHGGAPPIAKQCDRLVVAVQHRSPDGFNYLKHISNMRSPLQILEDRFKYLKHVSNTRSRVRICEPGFKYSKPPSTVECRCHICESSFKSVKRLQIFEAGSKCAAGLSEFKPTSNI